MSEGELKIKLHLHSIFTPLHSFDYPLREAILDRDGRFRIVCYQEQAELVQKYLGDKVSLRVGRIGTVENWLDIQSVSLLSSETNS